MELLLQQQVPGYALEQLLPGSPAVCQSDAYSPVPRGTPLVTRSVLSFLVKHLRLAKSSHSPVFDQMVDSSRFG